MEFQLKSKFKPTGDQPQAIKQLVENLKNRSSWGKVKLPKKGFWKLTKEQYQFILTNKLAKILGFYVTTTICYEEWKKYPEKLQNELLEYYFERL